LVNTITATIRPTITAAVIRLTIGCRRCSAMTMAGGMKVTMFSARSFGFPNRPLTGPASRPFSTRLMPRA
jgi:hypothetical protein